MIRAPLSVPVRYREREGSRIAHRYALVEAEIRVVEPAEAPVAIRWDEGHLVFEYRVFDGCLWAPMMDGWAHKVPAKGNLWPTGRYGTVPHWQAWTRGGVSTLLLDHPFRSRRLWAGMIVEDRLVRYDAGPRANDELELQTAEALAHVGDAIVVDGEVWKRSQGPVIGYEAGKDIYNRVLGPRLGYGHSSDLWACETLEARAFRWSALEPEAAAAGVAARFGAPAEILGRAPEVLIRDGYKVDLLPFVAEHTAWHMVWTVKSLRPGALPPEAITAVVALREALQERWPAADLTFAPSVHQAMWDHTWGRPARDPAPLVPALARVARELAGVVPDNVVAAWLVNLDRLAPAPAARPLPSEDAEAMAGFAV